MTWEQKVEMIRLSNQGKQKEMQDFTEPLLETMDDQDVDMLFTALELTMDNIKNNTTFFSKLASHMDKNESDFGLRTSLRIEFFKLLNEETKTIN